MTPSSLFQALAARAVADTARLLTDMREARAVVADAVQRGRCTVADLGAELRAGPVRGSATFRSVLAEVAEGIRSTAEGDLRGRRLDQHLDVALDRQHDLLRFRIVGKDRNRPGRRTLVEAGVESYRDLRIVARRDLVLGRLRCRTSAGELSCHSGWSNRAPVLRGPS